jgi:hypothetical protein
VVADFEQTTATMSTGTWYHIQVVRSGSTPYLFVDGTSVAVSVTTGFGNLSDISGVLSIGRLDASNGAYVNGWVDEVRISKGIARNTGDFTIPTAEYDSITTSIKKIAGVAYADIKKVGGVAIASVKKIAGLS